MENLHEEYRFVTVKYQLDSRQIKALEELLPSFQNYESSGDGRRPFADWTIDDLFQAVMNLGSKYIIADRIQTMQIKQGLIKWEDRVQDDFRTMEERSYIQKENKQSVVDKLHNNEMKCEKKRDEDIDRKSDKERELPAI